MAKTRMNMQINKEDTYFLNNLKNHRQWMCSRDEFFGSENLSDEAWEMVADYLFRLALDYTAYANNKKMREKKKLERITEIKKYAAEILKIAGLTVNECSQ